MKIISTITNLYKNRIYIARKIREYINLKLFLMQKNKIKIKPEIAACKSVGIMLMEKGIGDVIVCSGMIKLLRDNGYRVTVFTESRLRELFQYKLISVDENIEIKFVHNKYISTQPLPHVDIVINLFNPGSHTYRVIRFIRQISYYYLVSPNERSEVYDIVTDYDGNTHISNLFLNILHTAFPNIKFDHYEYAVNAPAGDNKVQDFLTKVTDNNRKKLIVINSKGGGDYKVLSKQTIQRICSDLLASKKDYAIVVMNFADDSIYNDQIVKNPFSSLSDSLYMVINSYCLITPDTSFVHFANSFKLNSICIYNHMGSSNVSWAPNYENALQISTDECSGDNKHGDDIKKIKYSIVYDALKKKMLI